MIVEIDVIINELSCFSECLDLRSVNTFCFQNRKEIFSQSIVKWIPTS